MHCKNRDCRCFSILKISAFTLDLVRENYPDMNEKEMKFATQELIQYTAETLKKDLYSNRRRSWNSYSLKDVSVSSSPRVSQLKCKTIALKKVLHVAKEVTVIDEIKQQTAEIVTAEKTTCNEVSCEKQVVVVPQESLSRTVVIKETRKGQVSGANKDSPVNNSVRRKSSTIENKRATENVKNNLSTSRILTEYNKITKTSRASTPTVVYGKKRLPGGLTSCLPRSEILEVLPGMTNTVEFLKQDLAGVQNIINRLKRNASETYAVWF